MDTCTQRELQYQEDASTSYLVVRPVEDRVSIGLGMALPAILGGKIMKDNEAHPMTTQIKSEGNFISSLSVTQLNPDSGWSSENDSILSGNEKIEAACYSLDMLDFFETQCYSLQKRCNLDPTVPATSFTLFPFLPVELQRKIWFYLLPPPSVVWGSLEVKDCDDKTKVEFCIRHTHSPTNFSASLPSYVLRSVSYVARKLFLENYRYLKFIGDANKKIRRFSDWDDTFRYVVVKRGPRPLLDTSVDNLYITNLFGLAILSERYGTSIDLTVLRCLTVDIINVEWMNCMPGARVPGAFLTELERLCPGLKRLFIVLNKAEGTRHPRTLRGSEDNLTNTQFLDFNQSFMEQLRYCQWIESCRYYTKIKWEIWNSGKECATIRQKTGSNLGYWSRVDVKPVWMVHTVPYCVRRSRNEIPGPFLAVEISHCRRLHLRCNADGTLPDQYDRIKELFDDGGGGDTHPSVDEEALIIIDND
ncbi:hypothetical protein EAF04_010864 [Stromatinia cepivora]|nr:hypothetical protein EAF04_010864 [Stromatinia cepivora]